MGNGLFFLISQRNQWSSWRKQWVVHCGRVMIEFTHLVKHQLRNQNFPDSLSSYFPPGKSPISDNHINISTRMNYQFKHNFLICRSQTDFIQLTTQQQLLEMMYSLTHIETGGKTKDVLEWWTIQVYRALLCPWAKALSDTNMGVCVWEALILHLLLLLLKIAEFTSYSR